MSRRTIDPVPRPVARPRPWSRFWLHVLLWPLLLLAGIVVHDVAEVPAQPTWEPVLRPTALDSRPSNAGGPVADCGAPARRWIVLGWDGASWDILLPLLDAGRLPNLAALIERGASGSLAGFAPSLSPALWTTAATGVNPDEHGIRGFDKRVHPLRRRLERITGLGRVRRELYSNADRRAPALWNLASDAGRGVMVIGYHNTYPAERVNGVMVSNYLVQAYIKTLMRANRPLPAPFLESLVWPPELTEEVLAIEHRVERGIEQAIGRFAEFDEAGLDEFLTRSTSLGPEGDRRMYFLRQAYLFDTFHAETALALYPRHRPDLLWVHFQGIDFLSHYFLYFHDPERFRDMPWPAATFSRLDAGRARFGGTVGAFHEYLDAWLGRLLALRDADTAVVVLSDHGFEPEPDPERGGHHPEAPPGIFVAEGPGIERGARTDGATLYDVLPTLLAALDLPVARDLPGRPLREIFCPESWAALGHRRVDTFAAPGAWAPHIAPPPELTDEIEAELKSLGYLR